MIAVSSIHYARDMIDRGYGVQNACQMAGVSVADYRAASGVVVGEVKSRAAPTPWKPEPAPRPVRLVEVAAPVEPLPPPPPIRITGREVAEYVAALYGLKREDFLGRSREIRFVRPRQVAMFAMRELCPHMSRPAIAKALARKDHTTVIWGLRKVDELIATDPAIAATAESILLHFRGMPVPECPCCGQPMKAAA